MKKNYMLDSCYDNVYIAGLYHLLTSITLKKCLSDTSYLHSQSRITL